ncbi:unnamed protein product [Oikopleura dioica]|uniref:N-alpha-acetyltransferase 20 n=1 Tax=Oikopleura dioica TaxID=34765 RepID=E4XC83_OIKDI|nr:unnamed protein product [Oikopleura dioica]
MTEIRPFSCFDLFKFNKVNLDPLTETYGLPFYLHYQAKWPEYYFTAEAPNGDIQGYIMGKSEGKDSMKQWHGHVTALTVQPTYRRLGLARKLMNLLEEVSERKNTWFVDLFVRQTNTVAHELYTKLGYTTYRRVLNYYGASSKDGLEEDAYDMRKSMSKDVNKETTEPLKRPVRPEEIEWH